MVTAMGWLAPFISLTYIDASIACFQSTATSLESHTNYQFFSLLSGTNSIIRSSAEVITLAMAISGNSTFLWGKLSLE